MRVLILVLFSFYLGLPTYSYAQSQLLILKKEKVLLRLVPGDIIRYRLKGEKQHRRSYINQLFDTAVRIHDDTISFWKIDRVYFKQHKFVNVIGGLLTVAGVGFFVIDEINVTVVQGNKPYVDRGVAKSAITLVVIGAPLMLIKKKSQRIRYPVRLLTARPGSPFFKSN